LEPRTGIWFGFCSALSAGRTADRTPLRKSGVIHHTSELGTAVVFAPYDLTVRARTFATLVGVIAVVQQIAAYGFLTQPK